MRWLINTKNLTPYKKLYTSVSLTTDYRFNTHARLSSLEGVSNLALILASTALIIVSFIVTLYEEEIKRAEVFITIGQHCLPIIILALSIMVSGAKYGVRAEKIHDCAQALNHFKKNLNFDINDDSFLPSAYNFKKYTSQYREILAKYENHSKLDYAIEEIRNIKHPRLLAPLVELSASIVGRGLLYYFYILICVMSIAWITLTIFLVINEVPFC